MLEEYNELMTVKEVAEVLKVSVRTAQKLVKTLPIKCLKIGKVYRVSKKSLINFIGGKA